MLFRSATDGPSLPRQLRHDVVVEAIEHDEKDANTGRKAQDALGRETIGLEQAVAAGPHLHLLLFVAAIQRREVEIRRGEIVVEIILVLVGV